MDNLIKIFNTLCQEADDSWQSSESAEDFEESFVLVLGFMKENHSARELMVRTLLDLMNNQDFEACDLVSFCMHELRWEEIKLEAKRLIHLTEDFRTKDVMADIIESYNDNWPGADLYSFYSNS